MTTASSKKRGAMVAVLGATGAVVGLAAGHGSGRIWVGVAVIGIVIGTAVARGMFSGTQDEVKKN